MITENILKLLKSQNKDDIILGVVLAVETLGEKWAMNNFLFKGWHKENPFPLPNDRFSSLLIFKNISVYIGPLAIEAIEKDTDRYQQYLVAKEIIRYD